MSRVNNRPPHRPSVTLHYAQTLDGRIATRTGQSQWISGEASLQLAHQLRAEHHAVMVGVGTVTVDNPRLTVRLASGPSPVRVVADSTLRLPMGAHVLSDGIAETVIATTARAPQGRIEAVRHRGATVLVVGEDDSSRVDLRELMQRLSSLGIGSLLIEGGRGIITSALRSQLVDRMVLCISPKVLGTGIEAVGDLGVTLLANAMTFSETCITPLGDDIIFDGRLKHDIGAAS